MEYFYKKKKHSIKDKIEILNGKNEKMYMGKSELISIGNKMHVFNSNNNEVFSIDEKMGLGRKKYSIHVNSEGDYEVLRKDSNKGNLEFKIKELDLVAKGDFTEKDYNIYRGIKPICKVNPKLISLGDMMRIDLNDTSLEKVLLGMILVIELEMGE